MDSAKASASQPRTRGRKAEEERTETDAKRRRTLFQARKVIGPNDIIVNPSTGKIKIEQDEDIKFDVKSFHTSEEQKSPNDLSPNPNNSNGLLAEGQGMSDWNNQPEFLIVKEEVEFPMDDDHVGFFESSINEASLRKTCECSRCKENELKIEKLMERVDQLEKLACRGENITKNPEQIESEFPTPEKNKIDLVQVNHPSLDLPDIEPSCNQDKLPSTLAPPQETIRKGEPTIVRKHRQTLPKIDTASLLNQSLELLLGYCTFEELKVCRQVCKLWRDNSLKTWKSCARFTPHARNQTKPPFEFIKFLEEASKTDVETLFTPNYYLFRISTRFLSNCGAAVKTLKIGASFESLNEFRNLIYTSFPNLEEIFLIGVNFHKLRGINREPTKWRKPKFGEHLKLKSLTITYYQSSFRPILPSWMELLSHFSSLHTLNLIIQGQKNVQAYENLFKSLILIRKADPRKLDLKNISLTSMHEERYPPSLLTLLQDSNLQLVSLSMRLSDCDVESTFREIFRIHSNSLKKLDLTGRCQKFPLNPLVCFPTPLENLQDLTLSLENFSSFAFLKFTPNLKTLSLQDMSIGLFSTKDWLLEMKGIRLLKCKNVSIGCNQFHPATNEEFKWLSKWLPNVQNLIFGNGGNLEFSWICESWPNLETLKIQYGNVDDCGISGWDKDDVKRINEDGANGTWRPITVPRANITNLKKLRFLSLHSAYSIFDVPGRFMLGYCSTLFGILPPSQCMLGTHSDHKHKYRVKCEERYGPNLC